MNDNFNYCHVAGKTDVGRKRAANEDNMYNAITQNGLVSVVCDGMGGHVGGATASKIAVSTIIENLNNVYYDDPRIAIGESIDRANKAIIQKTLERPELVGMGSTCVLLLVREGKVYIGHVGDSRIYLVRSKRIIQLTKDHSYVQMLVDCGEITKEQAEHHPRKNEITNALGIANMSPATVADDAIIPEAGDCFVLCSDGLSGMVSDDTICKIISRQSEMNGQERVDRLVELANENGGVDNITVQLVEFSVSPGVVTSKKRFSTWAKIVCSVVVLLVLCVGGYLYLQLKPAPAPDANKLKDVTENVVTARSTTNLGIVTFKKYEKIVEFSFAESSLKFTLNNKDKDTKTENNVSLDPKSLDILTPGISSDNTNTWLAFTDKSPGTSVEFSFTTFDKTEIYRYKIDIQNMDDLRLSISKGEGRTKNDDSKEESVKKEEEVKVDTAYVQFEYDKLEKGVKLILNYSAKPFLMFGKKEKKVDECPLLGKVLEGQLTYDGIYWKKDSEKGRLLFSFKGTSSDERYTMVIPCILRGSKDRIIIYVELIPSQKKGDMNPRHDEDFKMQTV